MASSDRVNNSRMSTFVTMVSCWIVRCQSTSSFYFWWKRKACLQLEFDWAESVRLDEGKCVPLNVSSIRIGQSVCPVLECLLVLQLSRTEINLGDEFALCSNRRSPVVKADCDRCFVQWQIIERKESVARQNSSVDRDTLRFAFFDDFSIDARRNFNLNQVYAKTKEMKRFEVSTNLDD